jgi:uncharacterized protein (TIGR00369 family)
MQSFSLRLMTQLIEGTATPTAWGPARRRTVTWHDPGPTTQAGQGLDGLALLGALRDGVLAPPPMAALLGFELVEVEAGRVVFECRPDASTYNPLGVVHGGLVCTLADTAAACAVHSTLPAGTTYTSIDLSVSYLRPVTTERGPLRAVGQVVKPGRRVAFARAEITDVEGKPVAEATSSCLVMAVEA